MKFLTTGLLMSTLHSAAGIHQNTDIFYHDREMIGAGMWTFSGYGVDIYSVDGMTLKKSVPASQIPGCMASSEDEDDECNYFTYASDGHKYVWAAAFGPNRVDVFDIDTGDYVTYIPTCSTPIDLDYHPNTYEMWVHCAGTDEANGHDGHIDAFSVNNLGGDMLQVNLNVSGRAYGRNVVHSTLGSFGYATVYKMPFLYKLDLATKQIAKQIPLPLSFGSYDITYSPVNRHLFLRSRVTCTCGTPASDKVSCGRGSTLVDVLTGPSAGMMNVTGTESGSCEGSLADTIGVYEVDTVTDTVVGSFNIKEGTGFGADPVATPDGSYILLMGNDGGQGLRVLKAGQNGQASTVFADIALDFAGGQPGGMSISDYAFMERNGNTVVVVASNSDNDVALIDMDSNPPQVTKLSLTSASESTGGRARNVEWAIDTDYVWVTGEDSDELYIIKIPDGDIGQASIDNTKTVFEADNMVYVQNYQTKAYADQLEEYLTAYFDTNPQTPNEVDPDFGLVGGLCFSGENTVEVEGRGSISMKDLKIGDNVRSEGGAFEKVYSFGHYDAKTPTDFLQIKSAGLKNPLEISANHMVFVQDGAAQKSVPAATLKVGDSLIIAANGNASKIGSIKKIQGRGAYAPFTASGKISVSGTVASNYIFVMETGPIVSMQWMAHAFNAPHRMLCSLNFGICENETYENGLSNWIAGPLRLGQWLAAQNSVVKFMGVGFLFSVFTVFSFLETVFFSTTPALALIVAALGMMAMTSRGTKKAKNL